MKKIACVLLVVLAMAGTAFADHDREERYIREEASRRGMTLISSEEAVKIARNRIGGQVRIKDVDLEDEDDYYRGRDDFRPVWQIEAVSGGQEYDVDVDAVTGEVLKCKIDY